MSPWWHIVLGTLLATLGGIWVAYGWHLKSNGGPDMARTVTISQNQGPIQYNENSPRSTQIINNKRTIKHEMLREKLVKDGKHLLRLTFQQTDGIWDAGSKFWMQIQLTGPYLKYDFISGYPKSMPLMDVTTTEGVPSAAQAGWIELQTATPPRNEPIVLEILSDKAIEAQKIAVSPTSE